MTSTSTAEISTGICKKLRKITEFTKIVFREDLPFEEEEKDHLSVALSTLKELLSDIKTNELEFTDEQIQYLTQFVEGDRDNLDSRTISIELEKWILNQISDLESEESEEDE